MNKQKLVRFINKYYLNGVVNSVILNSKSDLQELSARFISGDKTKIKNELDWSPRINFEEGIGELVK